MQICRIGWASAIALSLFGGVARAQDAPTGPHYAGRPTDTGFGGIVGPSGAYSTSIPIDLPPARGGVPIPVHLIYGGSGAGAAGVGWDVPLTYVLDEKSYAYRRPQAPSGTTTRDGVPETEDRFSLIQEGRRIALVHKGAPSSNTWVPRENGPELELHDLGTSWTMVDGAGRTYTFTDAGSSLLSTKHLWPLTSIVGPTGSIVKLEYATPSTASSIDIDLTTVSYNSNPSNPTMFMNQIVLAYGGDLPTALPPTLLGGGLFLQRPHTLTSIQVLGNGTILREIDLAYATGGDVDSHLPRLVSATMRGQKGKDEYDHPVPLGTFLYGAATSVISGTDTGPLDYELTEALVLPQGYTPTPLVILPNDPSVKSLTKRDSWLPPSADPAVAVGYTTWQSLTDLTGDGRPDFIFMDASGRLSIAVNIPGPAHGVSFATPVPLWDATFNEGAFEEMTATAVRFSRDQSSDQVWRQAIDMNGDGRIDIVDAAQVPGQWIVYLNTPDASSPSGIRWQRRALQVGALKDELTSRGLALGPRGTGFGGFLPLANRVTGLNFEVGQCLKWNAGTRHWDGFPDGVATGDCRNQQGRITSQDGPQNTFTEWELRDVNGDGYPDVVLNSSPTEELATGGCPTGPPTNGPQVVGCIDHFVIGTTDPNNTIEVAYDVVGAAMDVDPFRDNVPVPFSAPIALGGQTDHCGVGRWVSGIDADAPDSGLQNVFCELADVNGDGLLDRVFGVFVSLGTGDGFTTQGMTLPGPLSAQLTEMPTVCTPGAVTGFNAHLVAGLRDMTGDGIPDYVTLGTVNGQEQWVVYIGTGSGFDASPRPLGLNFGLSSGTDECDGSLSQTTAGLYDLDGDGSPDYIDGQGNVYQLFGDNVLADPHGVLRGAPQAGKLLQIDNGYGAKTTLSYVSAKDDPILANGVHVGGGHQVPFPEIVVSQVSTTGKPNAGNDLAPMAYAYRGIDLMFDTFRDAFVPTGYRRSVQVTAVQPFHALARITDTFGLSSASTVSALSRKDRLLRHLIVGQTSRVTTLSDLASNLPSVLLDLDVDNQRANEIAQTLSQYDAKEFDEPSFDALCSDLVDPYDLQASLADSAGGGNECGLHGFLFQSEEVVYKGNAGLRLDFATKAQWDVASVDDFGRVVSLVNSADAYRSDDDMCVSMTYASGSHVLTAPATRAVTDCRGTTLAAESWRYDGDAVGDPTHQPAFTVSAGEVTAHVIDRRDASGGELGQLVDFTASYDLGGNPILVARTRADGATQSVSTVYDSYDLAPKLVTSFGFGGFHAGQVTEDQTVHIVLDDNTLAPISRVDANGTEHDTAYDGFGRPTLVSLNAPGGPTGAVRSITYNGFAVSGSGRSVVTKTFTDPVAAGTVATAPGRATTEFFDELGRPTRSERALGADYGNGVLIEGARTYDNMGRVLFAADPYPKAQAIDTAYGTTHYYRVDGRADCFVRGTGMQPNTVTADLANEIIPTCYRTAFESDHTELRETDMPDFRKELVFVSAVGRPISDLTLGKGLNAPLGRIDYTHDAFGRQTGITRYLDPINHTTPVTTTWRYDSLGRLLEMKGPDGLDIQHGYDEWGDRTQTSWNDVDGTFPHVTTKGYDGLGRLVHSEEKVVGSLDPNTVFDYAYDETMGTPAHMAPTNLIGRLSYASWSTGSVSYSYDGLGNRNGEGFTSTENPNATYVAQRLSHADGTPSELHFFLPDDAYADEKVSYTNDSAGRMRSATFSDATGHTVLENRQAVDALGRTTAASVGAGTFEKAYAPTGRQMLTVLFYSGGGDQREIDLSGNDSVPVPYDSMGRELVRDEVNLHNAAVTSETTTYSQYDDLGRLFSSSVTPLGQTTQLAWKYTYDPLGNLTRIEDDLGSAVVTLDLSATDPDKLADINLGPRRPAFAYDLLGRAIHAPTPANGYRDIAYYGDGLVHTITNDLGAEASFTYDAFGRVSTLDVTSTATDPRQDRHFGDFFELRRETVNRTSSQLLDRKIPLPDGVATRHGPTSSWVYAFGEPRGNRFFTDASGAIVEDVKYSPYGGATSSSAPGTSLYSSEQWNGGDSLAAFGLVQLGRRLYDPSLGRFLSRDPLVHTSTANESHPYAFAANDPVNHSDPSGACYENPTGLCVPPSEPGSWPGTIGNPLPSLVEHAGGLTFDPDAFFHPTLPFVFKSPAQKKADSDWERQNFVGPVGLLFGLDCQSFGEGSDCGFGRLMLSVTTQVFLAAGGGLEGTAVEGVSELTLFEAEGEAAETALGEEAETALGEEGESADTICTDPPCCFMAGTLISTDHGARPIENIQAGDRVSSLDSAECTEPVEPGSCRMIAIEMANPHDDADTLVATFLRDDDWVARNGIERGATVWFNIDELSVDGEAQVVDVGSCRIDPGTGCLVTGTVSHKNRNLIRVRFADSDEKLEVTGSHRLWSADRNDWVAAGSLRSGDRLLSDTGPVTVSAIERLEGAQRVYNFEVAGAHTYLVSGLHIKSHNARGCGFDSAGFLARFNELKKIPGLSRKAAKDIAFREFGVPSPSEGRQILAADLFEVDGIYDSADNQLGTRWFVWLR